MKKLKVKLVAPRELTADLTRIWHGFQETRPGLASPFFCPEFAQAVGRHRRDLQVAIVENGEDILGFLPFHRKFGNCGVPVGGHINDYHGFIGKIETPEYVGEILRGCGLSAFEFDHALVSNPIFAQNAFWRSESPRADLQGGIDAWKSDIHSQTRALKTVERKRRKIEREIGKLRFVEQDSSDNSWATFVEWKTRALRDRGNNSFMRPAWFENLANDLRTVRSPDFGGCFSTLYAGDRLIAAHFGIRSRNVWHWWFPSFDRSLGQYSAGLLLLLSCVEHASDAGFDEVDFGRGTERYKKEFGNRTRGICEGSLEICYSFSGAFRRFRKSAQRLANRSLPTRYADITRRGANKLLRSGQIQ